MKLRIKQLTRLPFFRSRQTTLIRFADPVYEVSHQHPLPVPPPATRQVIESLVSRQGWVENRKRKLQSLLEVPGRRAARTRTANPEEAS